MRDDLAASTLLVLVIMLIFFTIFEESKIFATKTQATPPKIVAAIPIGTLDANKDGIVHEESLSQGQDYILGVRENWPGTTNLLYLDNDQDGLITNADPVFQYLTITSPINDHIPSSISNFGIRAIRFIKSGETTGYQAIFSDGESRWIYTH